MSQKVRIYAPAKTAMQSGTGKSDGQWVLEGIPQTPKTVDPLMGWTSAGDTIGQIKLYFETKDEAIAYAEEKGLSYTVQTVHTRSLKPKSYAANFLS